jgi:PAS domain S-box-containing protein
LGRLWIGTWGGGLDQFDHKNNSFIHYQTNPNDASSLSNNSVLSIYEDRSGILWVGNDYGGVNSFDSGKIKFVHYKKVPNNSNSLSANTIYSITETIDKGKKILWIGTQASGLNKFEREKNQFTRYQSDPHNPLSLSDNIIRVIVEDRTGTIWLGTNRGLNQFDREKNTFSRYNFDPNTPNRNDIFSIYEDRSGYLWVGTHGGGLNKFDPRTKKFISYMADPKNPNSLRDNYIWSILEDRAGILWIGTESGGLMQFDRENNRFIQYKADPENPNGLTGNKILCMHEDRSGVLWLGTTNGLNKFDRTQKRFSHYLESDGLSSNAIQSILEDDHGNLWLGTQKGLSKFDPHSNIFRNFKVSDGLQSNEFSVNACFRSQNGEMFFGGINGINTFFPDSIKDNLYVPSIVVTDFQIFNKTVPVGKEINGQVILEKSIIETKEIHLSYKENVFSFEFASLNLTSPEENQYAYMMEGFDKGWNYTDASRRFAIYTNMGGGAYVFRVKGSNSDGVWNNTGVSIRVIITPPFWMTLWFRILLVGAAAGIVFWIYKWRVQARDLTAQKKMEVALTKERNLFRTLIDHIPDVIYVKDTACRKTISNKEDVRLMGGHSESEVLGKTDFDFYHADAAAKFFATDQSVIQTGRPVLNNEECIKDQDGNNRWLLTSKLPLRDEHGTIIGLVGVGRDITQQKKAQEVLQLERNLLRTLIDNLPDYIYVKDAQGRFVVANMAVAHQLGVALPGDLIGKSDFDFFPRELAERYLADEQAILLQSVQGIYSHEGPTIDASKEEKNRWVSTTKVTLHDAQGNIVGFVGLGRDITEKKKSDVEREGLIKELQDAVADIKVLSGLVPICANCKKIRDDKGYWMQLEGYIQERSNAKFTHGICPDCMKELYPTYAPKNKE